MSALQSPNGELELKIMGQWLLSMILIYYYTTKSTWTWYTEQRKAVLGACAAISFYIRCSRGCWQHEIQEMLKDALYTPKHLHEMGFVSTASSSSEHHQLLARTLLDFVLLLAGYRAWSMFLYEFPPFSWAEILTDRSDHRTTGIMCAGSGVLHQ